MSSLSGPTRCQGFSSQHSNYTTSNSNTQTVSHAASLHTTHNPPVHDAQSCMPYPNEKTTKTGSQATCEPRFQVYRYGTVLEYDAEKGYIKREAGTVFPLKSKIPVKKGGQSKFSKNREKAKQDHETKVNKQLTGRKFYPNYPYPKANDEKKRCNIGEDRLKWRRNRSVNVSKAARKAFKKSS